MRQRTRMRMEMNGMNNQKVDKPNELFDLQVAFQEKVIAQSGEGVQALPHDSSKWFEYHCLAMMEEMGEVLKADKRWKTHRNVKFDIDEKLDELADVYITLMNICIHSNISMQELIEATDKKIKRNFRRLAINETDNN